VGTDTILESVPPSLVGLEKKEAPMVDIQNLPDGRNIYLQKVGVKKVHLPLLILEKDGGYQAVLGEISLCADLDKDLKGTHMSRFMETLNHWSRQKISSREVKEILRETQEKLTTRRAEILIRFRYFIEKPAPVTGVKGMLDYTCEFRGLLKEEEFHFILGVEVPINTVCPCSKELADHGAHNQRALVTVRIEYLPEAFLWLEDLIAAIEKKGSFEIFPVIKREDEKYITEKAYENPKFVEDVVQDIVTFLDGVPHVAWFEVECDSAESIHNHNAFAWQKEVKRDFPEMGLH
jgi:GTP cyclohydrolase IB